MYAFAIVFNNFTCTHFPYIILLSLTESLNFIINPISSLQSILLELWYLNMILLFTIIWLVFLTVCLFLISHFSTFLTFLTFLHQIQPQPINISCHSSCWYIYNYISSIHLIVSHCNNVKASFRYVLQEINSFVRINVIFIWKHT